MAGIEEVSRQLQSILQPDDPAGLLRQVLSAHERAEHETGIAMDALRGSQAPEATELTVRMARIVDSLSGIIGETVGALGDRNRLFAAWGLAGFSQTSAPGTGMDSPAERIAAELASSTSSKRLSEQGLQMVLDSPLPKTFTQVAEGKMRFLAARGIYTIRDAMVAGKKYVSITDGIGGRTTESIQLHLESATRRRLQGVPTPEYIASLCGSLAEVSYAGLHYDRFNTLEAQTFGFDQGPVTIQDLLDWNEADVFQRLPEDMDPGERSLLESGYREMVRRARAFAERFTAAKAAQRQPGQ